MNDIRLPRLLGRDLAEKGRLRCSSASATINITPLSTASLTLYGDEYPVSIRDFVEIYGPDGSLGIFRVSASQKTYGDQQQISLEHGIVTLEDDMTADGTVLSGSMKSMLTKLLSFQSDKMWALGDVEISGDLDDIEAGMVNLLEAVMTIVATDGSAMMTFDQSAVPWVLHVRKRPSVISSECRLNRNTNGVNMRLDDLELCTRVTVEDAAGERHTYDADTIGTWGVAHKSITADEGDDPEEQGLAYLDAHKDPALSVEIDALTLASMTGEPLDSFGLGGMCRVSLPEWGVAMDERIISIAYPSLFGQPGQVKLTLSGRRNDVSANLATLQSVERKLSKGVRQNLKYYHELDEIARTQAKRIELLAEDIDLRATKDELGKYLNEVRIELDAQNAAITLNAQHIDKATHDITAAGERIDGLAGTVTQYAGIVNSHGTLLSGVQVKLDGIDQTITQQAGKFDELGNLIEGAQIKLDGLEGRISLKADKTVTDELEKRISSAEIEIDAASASIALKANKTTVDALTGRVSNAEATLTVQAGEISTKVSKDGIISSINQTAEDVTISASKINLSGYVTASQLSALRADFDNLVSGSATASRIHATSLQVTNTLTAGNISWNGRTLDYRVVSINGTIYNMVVV